MFLVFKHQRRTQLLCLIVNPTSKPYLDNIIQVLPSTRGESHQPTNQEHNTRSLLRSNQYQKNMVDHVVGKIPPTAHPYSASPSHYLITTVLHQLKVPCVTIPLIRHKDKPVPILEVDFYVLKQSKQLLVATTTMIAQNLTKCHTCDTKMISETFSFKKSPSAHPYD